MSAADDLMQYTGTLQLNAATVPAYNVFADVEPDDTFDPAIVFKGYGAGPNTKTMELDFPVITTPRVQVTVRSMTVGTIKSLAKALWQSLFLHNTFMNGNAYTMVEPMSEPYAIGPDDVGRAQYAFNIQLRSRN